jgi:hypothetical protein
MKLINVTPEGFIFQSGSVQAVAPADFSELASVKWGAETLTAIYTFKAPEGGEAQGPIEVTYTEMELLAKEETAFPDASIEALKQARIHELNQARFNNEVGGFTVGGTGTPLDGAFIHTDERSQNKITGAALAASQDPTFSVDWQLTDSAFVTLNAPAVLLIANMLVAHEQAGRTHLKELIADVNAATSEAEINEIVW